MTRKPGNNGNAYRVTKTKKSFINRGFDLEIIGTHETRAFPRGQQARFDSAVSCLNEDLAATAAAGRTQAARDSIRAEFGH